MEPDRNSYGRSRKKGVSDRDTAHREPAASIPGHSSSQPIQDAVRILSNSSSTARYGPVDLPRLERALVTVSILLLESERYLPIFERLMDEREKLLNREGALSRARAFLDEQSASCEMGGNG